ncbi:MAG: phospholipase C [Terriglobales bacterium]
MTPSRTFAASFPARPKFLLLLITVAAMLALATGCGGVGVSPTQAAAPAPTPPPTTTTTTPPPPQGINVVNHIIFMLQENRAFDGYFGHLPNVDGLPAGASNKTGNGTVINAFHLQTSCIENADPDWLPAHGQYNILAPGSNTFMGDGFVNSGQGSAKTNVNQAGVHSLVSEVSSPTGTATVNPKVTTNYYLFANADAWTFYDTKPLAVVSVTVTNDTITPTPVAPNITPGPGVTFTATPSTIAAGQSVTLTWNVAGAKTTMVNSRYDQMGVRAMGYYDGNDLNYYYFMAQAFATSDRWYSPLGSNSAPNRAYLYAATSHGHVHDPGTLDSSVVPNIFQLLDAAGVSWRVYFSSDPSSPGVPHTFLTRFQPFASQHPANLVPVSQYLTDLQNGTLAQVSFIEELPGLDEHPGSPLEGNIHGGNSIQDGAQYVSKFINAFMSSQYWKDGVFILTFDEGGGLYDHVSPQPTVSPDGIPPSDLTPEDQQDIQPPGDFTRTGYRVPMIVVSPFTKPGYVSHTVADFTAIDKFIETRFNLSNLTARDKSQMDMTEFFNFTAPSTATPPNPPAQNMNLPCNYTNLP